MQVTWRERKDLPWIIGGVVAVVVCAAVAYWGLH